MMGPKFRNPRLPDTVLLFKEFMSHIIKLAVYWATTISQVSKLISSGFLAGLRNSSRSENKKFIPRKFMAIQ